MTCEQFKDSLAELAVGSIEASERSSLLSHASACGSCQAALEQMSSVADRLLDETVQIEPPAGFEDRVLGRLAVAQTHPGASRKPRPRLVIGLLAACALLLAGIAAVSATHSLRTSESASHTLRRGVLTRADGSTNGQVLLLDKPRPMVVVTVDHPKPFTGRVNCNLVLANGTTATVGTWSYTDVESGTWAVGVSQDWLAAVRMNVVNGEGAIVATSPLD